MAEYKDGTYIVKDGELYKIDIKVKFPTDGITVPLSDFIKQTNADRIRSMSDDELARKLCWIVPYCGDCPARIGNSEECSKDCEKAWLDWLRKETDDTQY